jgi:hypothetical protein
MSEDEVVDIIYDFICKHEFPKTCSNCGRVFNTLKEYLEITNPVGHPISYDAELDSWEPEEPIGTMSLANCSCGGTIAISSTHMPIKTLLRLMVWLKVESFKRKLLPSELLHEIRLQVDKKALNS